MNQKKLFGRVVMMRNIKYIIVALLLAAFATKNALNAQALYDPLSKNNNFFGIHILFTEELEQARKLVNSQGGKWGYVTIPIQIGDKDLKKWQKFMDDASSNNLIPIIRLATELDYKDTSVWRKPTETDIVDFANFLNSLNWPTENRYIIVFNEVNRFDEWGGESPNPREYAQILETAVDEFKERNDDFYIIMAGLDNGAPNDSLHTNNFTYLEGIGRSKPEVFEKIDGFSSHSYPNPHFTQAPDTTRMSIATYRHEYEYINSFTEDKKPVFLTETGWDNLKLSDKTIATFYTQALSIWEDDKDKIVAITPFLLNSHGGFNNFSFLIEGKKTNFYDTVENHPKTEGDPNVNLRVIKQVDEPLIPIEKSFSQQKSILFSLDSVPQIIKDYTKTILGL